MCWTSTVRWMADFETAKWSLWITAKSMPSKASSALLAPGTRLETLQKELFLLNLTITFLWIRYAHNSNFVCLGWSFFSIILNKKKEYSWKWCRFSILCGICSFEAKSRLLHTVCAVWHRSARWNASPGCLWPPLRKVSRRTLAAWRSSEIEF